MKKICFFSGDITRSGGTERVAITIANELAKNKEYEILFLSLAKQRETSFFPIAPQISCYHLGEKWRNPGPGYVRYLPKLRKFLQEHGIHILVDVDLVLDVLSIPASRGLPVKIISWDHFAFDFEMSVPYRRWILKYSTKKTDYVITLTKQSEDLYQQVLHRTTNIETIYNPVPEPEEELEETGEEQKEKWLITVSRLVPEKGMEYLLKVSKLVLEKHPEWKWLILGEGSLRQEMEKEIKLSGLENRVILCGNVTNVEDYLRKSEVCILTSKGEGLSLCLLEARVQGVPCVSFDVNDGPRELIENEREGYLIPPFDCDEMAEKIHFLIENEEVRRKMGQNARRNLDKFQMKYVIAQWENMIDTLH